MAVDAAGSPDAEHHVAAAAAADSLDAGHSTLDYGHPDSRNQSPGVDGRSHPRNDRLEEERP